MTCRRLSFLPRDFAKRSFILYRKSFKTSMLCPEGCTGHLSAEAFPFLMEDGKRPSLKRAFFSAPNDFSISGKRFFVLRQMIFVSLEGEKPIRWTRGNEMPGVECLLLEYWFILLCDKCLCRSGIKRTVLFFRKVKAVHRVCKARKTGCAGCHIYRKNTIMAFFFWPDEK